jgi:hypothetical protein
MSDSFYCRLGISLERPDDAPIPYSWADFSKCCSAAASMDRVASDVTDEQTERDLFPVTPPAWRMYGPLSQNVRVILSHRHINTDKY